MCHCASPRRSGGAWIPHRQTFMENMSCRKTVGLSSLWVSRTFCFLKGSPGSPVWGLLDSTCPWQGLCLGRLPPKKEYWAKPKRVEARDLFVHNAKLWSENLKLILVGNLRLLREQRKGQLELDPWDLERPPGKVRVLQWNWQWIWGTVMVKRTWPWRRWVEENLFLGKELVVF